MDTDYRPPTWHQQRGIERALGLHRWIGGDDTSCLHCGTTIDGDLGEDDRDYVPMTCGPNDARLWEPDDTYVPHFWGPGMHGIECHACGLEVGPDTLPAEIHATSCTDDY